MALDTVRPETGATVKPGPMVTAIDERSVDDDQLAGFAAGSGLNGPFVADLLSGFVAHERDGVNLFRTLRARSNNPGLVARYGELIEETHRAVDAWEALITRLGGNPQYASPAGRSTEALDGKLVEAFTLTGSADPLTMEFAGVQAVFAAACLCVANAGIVARLAQEADDGAARTALQGAAATLEPLARSHQEWARSMLEQLAVTQAKHPIAQKAGQVAEKVVGKVKDVFQ